MFFAQTDKPAERMINGDPEAYYKVNGPEVMGEEAYADLWAALRNPDVVHGHLEDYRAGSDRREHEEADRAAGRRVECPMLLLAAARDIDIHGDPVEIWRPWVAGRAETIDSGHHQAEEAPEALSAALLDFLDAR